MFHSISFIHIEINKMIIRKLAPVFIILLFLSFVLTRGNLYGKPFENKELTSKQAKHLEDVKKNLDARLQDITNLKSGTNALKEELKVLNTTIEELTEGKAGVVALDLVMMVQELKQHQQQQV